MPVDENLSSPVAVLRENRVTRVVLNDPGKRNRLTPGMASALAEALFEAADDPGTGSVLLEQRGEVFCSGFDFEALALAGDPEPFRRLFSLRQKLRKPAVAAVHGACAGAGIGLLLQCHYVLAAQGTKFAVTDIHSACWPVLYYGALCAAMGPRRACELSLTGRVFSAADALAYGLVQELVPEFELEDRALQMAAGLASLSPAAVAAGLEFAAGFFPESAGNHAEERFREATCSPDFREALAATSGRRRPEWPSLRGKA